MWGPDASALGPISAQGGNTPGRAVARRLARLMWALWRHERAYDPNHVATPAARQHDVTAADLQAHASKLRAGAAKLAKQRKESARRGQMAHELTKGDEVTMAL